MSTDELMRCTFIMELTEQRKSLATDKYLNLTERKKENTGLDGSVISIASPDLVRL